MALVRCESVSEGLRASEALASIRDYHGRRHSIRVERDFLSEINGDWYLPMGVIHIDPKTRAVLLEFPHEPETGINRIWVKPEMLDQPLEVYA
jgi:hypothetical protein